MSGTDPKCQVCQDVEWKYKCPKCRLKYCSVGCYKDHRQGGCSSCYPEPSVEIEVDVYGNVASQVVLFPTDDTVMPTTLDKLCDSSKLRGLLKNQHLRDLLKEVDRSRHAETTMQRAMMEPIFTEFADEVLSIVEPSEDNGSCDSDEDV